MRRSLNRASARLAEEGVEPRLPPALRATHNLAGDDAIEAAVAQLEDFPRAAGTDALDCVEAVDPESRTNRFRRHLDGSALVAV